MLAFMNYPTWIKPEIIPGFPLLRWYGLMYVFAFGIAYLLFKYQTKKDKINFNDEDVSNFFFWTIIGLLLGARLFSTLFYEININDPYNSFYYWKRPWLIFWPFRNGQFTGLEGMSYHGGVVGAVVASMIYLKSKKFRYRQWVDYMAAGIPLGYTFGRLGNFANGELYGRVSTGPFGMIFPTATTEKFSSREDWVSVVADKVGMVIDPLQNQLINLPRHPSQLYEAFFEGIVLWAFLWFVVRKFKKYDGQVLASYILGYGVIRFFIEYFREPDSNLGFIFGSDDHVTALFTSFFDISMGQIFCLMMVLAGLVLMYVFKKMDTKERLLLASPKKNINK